MLLALAVAFARLPEPAAAIVVGTPTVSLSNTAAGTPATYAFGGYTTDKNRPLSWVDLTFPAGTTVTGATAVLPNTTVTVTGPTSVRVRYSPVVPGSTDFSVAVGGIVNPPAATYPADSVGMVCRTTNNGGAQTRDEPAATAGYSIIAGSYISMTITTPDTGQTVDFGSVDPGVTVAGKRVTVSVTSSAAYTISRTIGGDSALLGLTVSGNASGTGYAGTAAFDDDFAITPPWTSEPDITYVATVVYTVAQ